MPDRAPDGMRDRPAPPVSLRQLSRKISKPKQMSSKNCEILTGVSSPVNEHLHKFWAQLEKVWMSDRPTKGEGRKLKQQKQQLKDAQT